MFRTRLKSLIALPAMAGVLLLTACQATGAGTVPSGCLWDATQARNPGLKNTPAGFLMAFKADNSLEALLLGTNASWSGTYVDPCAGVAFRGTGLTSKLDRVAGHPTGGWAGTFVTTYVSTVPSKPGRGTLSLFAWDSGTSQGDLVALQIIDGPFKGYSNGISPTDGIVGVPVTRGNITVIDSAIP
jgi:hypothetical protein